MGWSNSSKGKKGSSKGTGKGKSGGVWAWIPAEKPSSSSWGKSSGKKGGKAKGKGKGKGKATPFSELSEERKEAIRQRHEEIHIEQGRELVGDTFYFGEVSSRSKRYGWIKPANFAKLPPNVQAKLKEMVKAKKANAKENNGDASTFNQNVLFVHMSDVEEGVKINVGDRVKFKVYTDTEGVGATEVTTA
eukprot:TRINITY_DN22948_c1_g1_i1.p2 TRINITY_DN22948_c1_g1~~TRINITY_DN22948_c1_g1_i1.p2  ORF type:complete len:215 (+),score=76.53 TRINITY_DN22948_c1_g1_i1:78-647(+)